MSALIASTSSPVSCPETMSPVSPSTMSSAGPPTAETTTGIARGLRLEGGVAPGVRGARVELRVRRRDRAAQVLALEEAGERDRRAREALLELAPGRGRRPTTMR